jgi:HEAT repeat protein
MRYLTLAAALLAAAGCGASPPTMVHGQPVGHWLEAVRDADARTRKKAVQALGRAGAADAAALPALAEALKDRDAGVRQEAASALLRLGEAARPALAALEEARRDRDARVRASAERAVERLRGG